MRRIYILTLFVASISSPGCKKDPATTSLPQTPKPSSGTNHSSAMRYSGADYSQPIAIDTANRMIQSYLASINPASNNTILRSMTFDADTLRSYLLDSDIKTVKFMLAHTPAYMNSGRYGQDAGNAAGAVTFIIVGLNEDNDFVYNAQGKVYDHIRPCPTNCDDVSQLLVQ